ncbi:selenium metabolism-associated LysR family transcriptional regulator [Desulfosporosinus nitroreducens]|uniref:Selenium metabolism-associated LysR family transcriptional regulator n=1 Tax=Desulfosporosinus nitroreducens TaxID=2018668 RepID=A0ABT8QJJ7_9FIRM|nr:selenium metabolism-associated LysR family transcriptional regulator [Desulfosporosinus nitroreducens]MDO0821472.1 selenium metabolism-associated LysR family transcriptional regulator [Desulfosporosinus nitroreducens]
MLDLMRLFAQVVEEQSFTMVARKLGISQPAVSNQIRAFEEKLGVKLLYRKGKGFALTQEGETVYRHTLHMLDEWSELMREIGDSEKLMSGKVHIGASHIPGEYLLPIYLAAFRKQYPEIKFKLSIGDSLEMAEKVLAHEVDFAVVGAIFDTEKLTSEFWLKDELGFVISSDNPLCASQSIDLKSLREDPMIIRETGSGHRRAFEEALTKQGLDLNDFNIALEVGSTEAVKNAVRSGIGYSFLSKHALESCEKQGLVWANVKDFYIERGFYLLTRRNKPLTVAADASYRYLASQMSETRSRRSELESEL